MHKIFILAYDHRISFINDPLLLYYDIYINRVKIIFQILLDFSILYTTLPHNLIKGKLIDLIERTFNREGSAYFACNDRNAFFFYFRKT